jgi:hypothetical protein
MPILQPGPEIGPNNWDALFFRLLSVLLLSFLRPAYLPSTYKSPRFTYCDTGVVYCHRLPPTATQMRPWLSLFLRLFFKFGYNMAFILAAS